jgi:hypothetical protein
VPLTNAVERASCARINACGEEGSGDGLTASVKTSSRKQESILSYLGMDWATTYWLFSFTGIECSDAPKQTESQGP